MESSTKVEAARSAHAVRQWRDAAVAWVLPDDEQERQLPFTLIAVGLVAMLGLIIVPLSIPEPLPQPDPAQVLAERFVEASSVPGSPTVIAGVKASSVDEAATTYGVDGGAACTGSLAQAYDSLRTGGAFDSAAFARIKVAHSVYCPDRTDKFGAFVKRRAALNAEAARLRAAVAQ